MVYAMWMGSPLESNKDNLLATLYFSCIWLIDIYGFFLYIKISRKSDDRISNSQESTNEGSHFGDIMTLGSGIDANHSKKYISVTSVKDRYIYGLYTPHKS